MLKLVVLVSGGGTNLQAILDAMKEGRITDTGIAAVISNNPNAYALERAKNAGVPGVIVRPADFPDREAFHEALLAKVNEFAPDLIVLAGFMVQVPLCLVRAYPNKIINIHPALIPSFCGKGFYGLRVHQAALDRGVKLVGATVHFVNENLDEGPIILQKAVAVRNGDTPEVLQRRVMEEAEWIIMPEAIQLIAHGKVTVEGKRTIISED